MTGSLTLLTLAEARNGLARKRFELGFRELDPREGGDMCHGGLIQRHDLIVSATGARKT